VIFIKNTLIDGKIDIISPSTTRELFKDFCRELQNYPLTLNEVFPYRVKRYYDTIFSMFWKNSKNYVKNVRAKIKKGQYQIPEEDLLELEQKIKESYGLSASKSIELIDLYKKRIINGLDFLKSVKKDLGKRSKQIPVTNQELSIILAGTPDYVRKILKRMRLKTDPDYNPYYKIARSTLERFEDQFDDLLGPQARNLKIMIKCYIQANPDLKEYPNQQYTITNPYFFDNLETDLLTASSIPKFYWLGFLWADGRFENESKKIILKLKEGDYNHIEMFSDDIGFPRDRIKRGIEEKEVNGEFIHYGYAQVKFGCKPMAEDLNKYGFTEFKNGKTGLPQIIKDLIFKAKRSTLKPSQNYSYKLEGKCALSFLLGFYDGDGNLRYGKYPSLYNSNRTFLDEIKTVYGIKNRVCVHSSPRFNEKTKSYTLTNYSLNIGISIFRLMLNSFKGSMKRKRPIGY